MQYPILLFEDETDLRQEIEESITLDDVIVYAFESWKDYSRNTIPEVPALAILDINLLDKDGLSVFQELKLKFPDLEGIVITGQSSLKNAIASLKIGISDYIEKPFRAKTLREAIERQESYKQFRVKNYVIDRLMEDSKKKFESDWGLEFIGISQSMKEVNTLMKRVAQTDLTSVMIIGESGSGKELIARGVHSMSDRRGAPFYPVKCTSIPTEMFEKDLLGYHKGAFNGALSNQEGWFEKAHGGTLFLDEVGDLDSEMQSKLLRVIDEGKVSPIGSTEALDINVRIVCTSNKNLKKMAEDGLFREDLYHRLNKFQINMPPLRERNEDIPLLVSHFIKLFAEMHHKYIDNMHSKAMSLLLNHHYPGNVRELKNIIERAVLVCDSNVIRPQHLSFSKTGDEKNESKVYSLEEAEKEAIIKAMKVCGHNKTRTAEKLEITRQALNRKLKRHGIQ